MVMKRRNKLRSTRYSVGIDEVGRGALAGPVVVAAVAVLANSKWPIRQAQGKQSAKGKYRGGMLWHTTGKRVALRDSKKLSARQREAWFAHFKTVPDLRFAIARVYPRQIECLNISRAANTAAMRAFKRLIASGGKQRANNKE